jgi:hypothetical protein
MDVFGVKAAKYLPIADAWKIIGHEDAHRASSACCLQLCKF